MSIHEFKPDLVDFLLAEDAEPDTQLKPPAPATTAKTTKGASVDLTLSEIDAASAGKLEISSPAFASGGRIPSEFSEYGNKVSPPLQWQAVKGAQSYALVVEDPDAPTPKPVVHWVAWNIPATATSLPEGLQKQPRLSSPEGVMQGRTTHGDVGYFGPCPPIGDPDHHYHFQLLALDRELDIPSGSDRDTVIKSAKGHILAKGELIGLFSQAAVVR